MSVNVSSLYLTVHERPSDLAKTNGQVLLPIRISECAFTQTHTLASENLSAGNCKILENMSLLCGWFYLNVTLLTLILILPKCWVLKITLSTFKLKLKIPLNYFFNGLCTICRMKCIKNTGILHPTREFFKLCNIYNIHFATLTIHQCKIQWHSLHSQDSTVTTTVYFQYFLITLKRNAVPIKQ